MAHEFAHQPVLSDEVVAAFGPVPAGVVVDATVGGGGHAVALLRARLDLRVLGLDRDPTAVEAARGRLAVFGERADVRHARFSDLADEVAEARQADRPPWTAGVAGVAGILADLGVSSPQVDQPERGFSYRQTGPLDMRMDPTSGASALELVNTASAGELAALFAANGESRLSHRIARAVVAARPLATTTELADVVAGAVPAAVRRRGHPATRVFQALRIAVNDELDELAALLAVGPGLLVPGGRAAVIAYHSGEDAMVKAAFAEAATGGCTCPPGLPCVCGATVEFGLVFRGARTASADERARNPRSESARLRVLERLVEPLPARR